VLHPDETQGRLKEKLRKQAVSHELGLQP